MENEKGREGTENSKRSGGDGQPFVGSKQTDCQHVISRLPFAVKVQQQTHGRKHDTFSCMFGSLQPEHSGPSALCFSPEFTSMSH